MPTTDGAGVRLTRVIGQPALRNLDPFVLLDRFHSDDPGAYIAGFPDHPHRGFETVTVMLAGQMRHRDSRGNAGLITGGGAQWMTAGRGIVHSEMPEQDQGLMSGFQLWVNLPAKEKMSPAGVPGSGPPRGLAEGGLTGGSVLRVIAGRTGGLAGPVRERPTEPLLLTARLEDDRPVDLELPTRPHGVRVRGERRGGDRARPRGDHRAGRRRSRSWAPATGCACARPTAAARCWSPPGRPLHEPIVQRGPFVMNTEAEIERAIADYRAGVLDR